MKIYIKKLNLLEKGLRNNFEKQKLAERQTRFVEKKKQLAIQQSKVQHRLESNPETVLGMENDGLDIIFDADDYGIAAKGGISGIINLLLNKDEIIICEDKYFIWKTPKINISTDLFLDKKVIKEVPLRYFTEQDSFKIKVYSKK